MRTMSVTRVRGPRTQRGIAPTRFQLTTRGVPAAVAGGHTLASLTTGGRDWYACGLTPTGATYCWGTSPSGGGLTPTPVGVAGDLTFAMLSNGLGSTCGVTTAGGGRTPGVPT